MSHDRWRPNFHLQAKTRTWYVPATDGRTYYYSQMISNRTLRQITKLGTAKEMLKEMRAQAEYAIELNLEDHGAQAVAA